jgi:hypothetical protein
VRSRDRLEHPNNLGKGKRELDRIVDAVELSTLTRDPSVDGPSIWVVVGWLTDGNGLRDCNWKMRT